MFVYMFIYRPMFIDRTVLLASNEVYIGTQHVQIVSNNKLDVNITMVKVHYRSPPVLVSTCAGLQPWNLGTLMTD